MAGAPRPQVLFKDSVFIQHSAGCLEVRGVGVAGQNSRILGKAISDGWTCHELVGVPTAVAVALLHIEVPSPARRTKPALCGQVEPGPAIMIRFRKNRGTRRDQS